MHRSSRWQICFHETNSPHCWPHLQRVCFFWDFIDGMLTRCPPLQCAPPNRRLPGSSSNLLFTNPSPRGLFSRLLQHSGGPIHHPPPRVLPQHWGSGRPVVSTSPLTTAPRPPYCSTFYRLARSRSNGSFPGPHCPFTVCLAGAYDMGLKKSVLPSTPLLFLPSSLHRTYRVKGLFPQTCMDPFLAPHPTIPVLIFSLRLRDPSSFAPSPRSDPVFSVKTGTGV